jgi:hypothetical protein
MCVRIGEEGKKEAPDGHDPGALRNRVFSHVSGDRS